MAIKIQTKQIGIPVEIGELNFVFDTSDESVKKFRKDLNAVYEKLEKIDTNAKETEDEDKLFDEAKEYLSEGFELILGEGSFDKIYEQTPSVLHLIDYFVKLAEGIKEELSDLGIDESQKELTEKYLAKKKK